MTADRTALLEALAEALDAVTAAEDAGDMVGAARHRAAAQVLQALVDHRHAHQPHAGGRLSYRLNLAGRPTGGDDAA